MYEILSKLFRFQKVLTKSFVLNVSSRYIYFYAPFPPKVLDRSILDKIKLIIEMECFEQINGNDERLQVSYVNKSEKFVRRNQEFNRQFAHIYSSRLGKLSNLLASKVEQKWGEFEASNASK
jgi:hypothetical protein